MKLRDRLGHSPLPRLESHLLWQEVLGVSRSWLVAHDQLTLDAELCAAYDRLEARRLAGEPMAYILGYREFFSRDFHVSPDVLIPRPETELLVECALQAIERVPQARVLDLGTGSGVVAITIALERRDAQVAAVDSSSSALAVAKMNACNLGATLGFARGSWYDTELESAQYDLVVSNPPYVAAQDIHLDQGDLRFEPQVALVAGADGLEALRQVIGGAPAHLVAGGALCVEHGWDQGATVRELFSRRQFVEIGTLRDLAGNERVTWGRLPA